MDPAPAQPRTPRARPRDRRVQIARNAGELFSARGFHSVRMDDIAEASGITARALYRHYQNKQALLAHVVIEDQDHVVRTLEALTAVPVEERQIDDALLAVVEAAVDGRRLSLLWQREARHLSPEDFRLVRTRTRWIARQLQGLFVDHEGSTLDPGAAEIRSWALVSIVSGHAFYETVLTKQALTQQLVDASRRVLAQPAHPVPPALAPVIARPPASRREQLIQAATSAFRAKGFSGVAMDEIGAEVGVVGPALYRYFDTKADILAAAVNRFQEWLALEAARAMRTPGPDETVIVELVRGYVRVALEATDLLAVTLTEWLHLPAAVSDHLARVRDDHLTEWQRWLSVARPDLPEATAALLVSMTKTLVDDCARVPNLYDHPGFADELTRAACATLGLREA